MDRQSTQAITWKTITYKYKSVGGTGKVKTKSDRKLLWKRRIEQGEDRESAKICWLSFMSGSILMTALNKYSRRPIRSVQCPYLSSTVLWIGAACLCWFNWTDVIWPAHHRLLTPKYCLGSSIGPAATGWRFGGGVPGLITGHTWPCSCRQDCMWDCPLQQKWKSQKSDRCGICWIL